MKTAPAAALLAIFGSLAPATAAMASFPGENGKLVAAVDGCGGHGSRHLVAPPWRGGPLTPITTRCDVDFVQPDASPDGETIIAVQEEDQGESGRRQFAFTTVAPDGSNRQRIALPDEVSFAGWPSFAPDGERFAFADDHPDGFFGGSSIWEMRLDGSGARTIREHPPCGPDFDRQNCSALLEPRWSPDGELIAVVVSNRRYDVDGGFPMRRGIWLLDADTGEPVRRIARTGAWVDWSPAGRRLVYSSYYTRSGNRAAGGTIYVIRRDGSNRRALVDRNAIAETEPTWSPDGRFIAWVSVRFSGGGDVHWDIDATLWRMRVRGGKPRKTHTLPSPGVEEGYYNIPELTWLPR